MVEREGDKCRPPEQVWQIAFLQLAQLPLNKRRKEGKKNINKQVKKKDVSTKLSFPPVRNKN